jgi:nitroimidazol reductase NimA-like FMN-containing flavoprotein (pyridoxamine 5'-phosphate oxidase superfamily)
MANPTARDILTSNLYATIATVDDMGNPWNTPVFYAVDDDSNIYWSSHPESVHSLNIERNHKVFIVVYNSKAGEGEGVGVYIQASADIVEDHEAIRSALALLGARRAKPFLHMDKFLPGGPQRIYRATPLEAWINDADKDNDGDFIRDFRISVDI